VVDQALGGYYMEKSGLRVGEAGGRTQERLGEGCDVEHRNQGEKPLPGVATREKVIGCNG